APAGAAQLFRGERDGQGKQDAGSGEAEAGQWFCQAELGGEPSHPNRLPRRGGRQPLAAMSGVYKLGFEISVTVAGNRNPPSISGRRVWRADRSWHLWTAPIGKRFLTI
ncbi:MAG: hypothetical protein ACREDJ_08795, partial [Methylocella sp.]